MEAQRWIPPWGRLSLRPPPSPASAQPASADWRAVRLDWVQAWLDARSGLESVAWFRRWLLGWRHPASSRSAGAQGFDLARFREQRFAGGLACPRCGHGSVHRWGWSGTRRRYRCLGCRRTFNDLTGTPLAYLKRLDRWPSFCGAMVASLSVRRTAARVGVSTTTAFRWRHRLLDALRAADSGVLEGDVMVAALWFPISEKGSRNLDRPPRRRGSPWEFADPRAWVVLACDAAARPLALLAGLCRPRLAELEGALLPRLGSGVSLSDTRGSLGTTAYLARRHGLTYGPAPSRLADPAVAYGGAVRRWLADFRGVATRYLPNYLVWHRFLALALLADLDPPQARDCMIGLSLPEPLQRAA